MQEAFLIGSQFRIESNFDLANETKYLGHMELKFHVNFSNNSIFIKSSFTLKLDS